MNTREQQDKEYRAQWIRDAARDLVIALHASPLSGPSLTWVDCWNISVSLWEKYEQERGPKLPGVNEFIEAQFASNRSAVFRKNPSGLISASRKAEGEATEALGHGNTLAEAVADALMKR